MSMVRLRNISNEYATNLQMQLRNVAHDDKVRKEINQMIADMIEPYVPQFNGEFEPHNEDYDGPPLRESVQVGPTQISWNTPYSHYMWMGNTYGPNIPIHEKGNPSKVIAFYSPNKEEYGPKYPTGDKLSYSTANTGPRWWDFMLSFSQNRRTMNIRITNILKRYIKAKRK